VGRAPPGSAAELRALHQTLAGLRGPLCGAEVKEGNEGKGGRERRKWEMMGKGGVKGYLPNNNPGYDPDSKQSGPKPGEMIHERVYKTPVRQS